MNMKPRDSDVSLLFSTSSNAGCNVWTCEEGQLIEDGFQTSGYLCECSEFEVDGCIVGFRFEFFDEKWAMLHSQMFPNVSNRPKCFVGLMPGCSSLTNLDESGLNPIEIVKLAGTDQNYLFSLFGISRSLAEASGIMKYPEPTVSIKWEAE